MSLNVSGAAPARVTFTEFLVADAPMLLAWARFRSSLTESQGAPTARRAQSAHRESGLWRLLATNNRELGRSFMLYHHFEAARAHVKQLQARADSLTIEHVPGPNKSSRGWVIVDADAPVMMCSRWYSSLSAGVVSSARALEAFGTAVLADSPDRSDASGRFRRRAPLASDARS